MILKLKRIAFTTIKVPFLGDVDINNMLMSNKIFSGEFFVGYLYDDYTVNPLHIMLWKTTAYVKSCDCLTKWIYFLIKNGNLLEKYNTIWYKVSPDIKKEFDSSPVYNKKFLKPKVKSYDVVATDFYDKVIPKAGSDCICLAVITINSTLKKDENYYLQVLLRECKYIEVTRHITEDIEVFSSDYDKQYINSKYRDMFLRKQFWKCIS